MPTKLAEIIAAQAAQQAAQGIIDGMVPTGEVVDRFLDSLPGLRRTVAEVLSIPEPSLKGIHPHIAGLSLPRKAD